VGIPVITTSGIAVVAGMVAQLGLAAEVRIRHRISLKAPRTTPTTGPTTSPDSASKPASGSASCAPPRSQGGEPVAACGLPQLGVRVLKAKPLQG
jgi:hypothetical protein